jgi:hypothetical protein
MSVEPEDENDHVNSWEDLLRWKPDFPDVIQMRLRTVARLVIKTTPRDGDDMGQLIVACLGASLPDIDDVMTLSHKNSHHSAGKILRGFFERVVSIKYLSENPSEVQRFLDFAAIDTEDVIRAIEQTVGISMEEPSRSNLANAATAARKLYKQDKCSQCKKPRYIGWTGMNTKDMADRVGLGHMYLHAFLLTSKVLHTTLWGMRNIVSRSAPIINNLNCLHELIIHLIILHRRHFMTDFHGQQLQKIQVTPLMTAALREFLRTWTYSTTSFDGIFTRGSVDSKGQRIYY